MNNIVSLILPYYNRKRYLKVTLDSLQHFYSNREDFQIVIVDDGSDAMDRPGDLLTSYNLWMKIVNIKNKRGINPCYPINVGVRESEGDVILLSSPEILHTTDIFRLSSDFEQLHNENYLQFSVFCITDIDTKIKLFDDDLSFREKLQFINSLKPSFYENLGTGGARYANKLGAWYTHGKLKNDCYNFLSACTRETYYNIGGFNEIFVHGTGYDDTDFRDRLLKHVNNDVVWYDDCVAIHIDHPAVSGNGYTNMSLYNKTRNQIYEKNDLWGRR